ncbi:MAG: hypothetical protein ACK5JH_02890 [Anaerocolumna sp.]
MFKRLFTRNKVTGELIMVRINDKIMPIDRGEIYEDPLDEFLRSNKYGEVTGGGTMQLESGEIEFCDLEVMISPNKDKELVINEIITLLESQGAPKGSLLSIEKTSDQILFGKREGLAIYLDGINLPTIVYEECDSNYVLHELGVLIGDSGTVQRHWQGETETALYFYGESFEKMNNAISEFIKTYPLCEGARVVQIA